MSRVRALTIVVAAAAIAACGGGGDGADVSTTTPAANTTAAPATTDPDTSTTTGGETSTTEAVADADIVISNFSFTGTESVAVGSTVTVVNEDSIGHTWTVNDLFDSGTLTQGDTFEFTFDEAGEYQYFCAIHPTQMTGTLTVEG